MATLVKRGAGTPATSGATWTTVTNAVDGTPPAIPGTYAIWTSAVSAAVGYIEVTGYDFSGIADVDTLNSVTVSLRHHESTISRYSGVTFQAYLGATPVGSPTAATLSATQITNTATVALTLAQLKGGTLKIRATATRAAVTQSATFNVDHIDVTADYTPLPPTLTQAAYRLYADGTETGATALAGQDTGHTADLTSGDVNLQVRVRLQSTNAAPVGATDDFQLQWEKNTSGSWVPIGSDIVADSYPPTNYDTDFLLSNASPNARGQSFRGNGSKLRKARFWGFKAGTPVDNLVAALYAHSGSFGTTGVGTGSALATASIAASSVTGTSGAEGWIELVFDGTYTLAAGTPYVIAAGRSGATDFSNYIAIGGDGSSTAHAGNSSVFAGSWTSTPSNDLIFEVYTPATTVVAPYASANLTDAAATTTRLTGGSGTFTAGKVSEDGLVDDLGWAANNHTELLYSVTLKAADLANADTLRFRVLRNGATTGLTYTQVPTITVLKGAAVGGKPKVWTGATWTEKPVKVWSGSGWVEKPMKYWTGSAWVPV